MEEQGNNDGLVLILGASGYLGGKILHTAGIHGRSMPTSRIGDVNDLDTFSERLKIELGGGRYRSVVNALGVRNGSRHAMHMVNATVPEIIVSVAAECHTRVVHLGSIAEASSWDDAHVTSGDPAMILARTYAETKRRGSEVCLASGIASVLRVHNLHGLPHQHGSGIHHLCQSLRHLSSQDAHPFRVVNTTRDYIGWQRVVKVVLAAAFAPPKTAYIDVCSGLDITVSEIVGAMPVDVGANLASRLIEPDWPVATIQEGRIPTGESIGKAALIRQLASEVVTCAFS